MQDAVLGEIGDMGFGDLREEALFQASWIRDRACSFERRIGSIAACHLAKFDLPRRVGMVPWEVRESSAAE